MTDSTAKTGMTRAEVFAELVRRGADRALVEFSGGNDEGGPDAITLCTGEAPVCTLCLWPCESDPTAEQLADARLADALSDPVFEIYGTFAGDFDVSGEVIWNVGDTTVQMIRDERSDYEHSEDYL
jgi:hypothetical protein